MHRSYQLSLKTTKRQTETLTALLRQLCELYNICLEQRRAKWKLGLSTTYYDQQRELTELRSGCEEYAAFPVAIQRDSLRRVQRAFDSFFRRCQTKQAAGYPRFRSQERYDSFTVDGQNFRVEGSTITIVKLGGFKFKTRCRIRGTAKELHIKRSGNQWKAVLSCEIGSAPAMLAVSRAVGIDVGLTSLVTLSDGSEIENPRWTKQYEQRLANAQGQLAGKKRGSGNRAKAKEKLRRMYQRISGKRRLYLHAISAMLIAKYDLIAFEKLNITAMSGSHLGKSILDAAWRELIWQITYKAEEAGKWAVPVGPRGTTQMCSGCGEKVPKKLRERSHECANCGLVLGRDHNAAVNILALGESAVVV